MRSSGCRNDGGGGGPQLNRAQVTGELDEAFARACDRVRAGGARPQDDYADLDWLYQDQPKAS